MSYPQAVLPETRIGLDYLKALVVAQRLNIDEPEILTGNGLAFHETDGVCIRSLHNCGTNAVKYLVSDTENASVDRFHGILAAGAAQDDGTGTYTDLSRFKGRISIWSATGVHRVCAFRAHGPERLTG